MQRRQLGYTQGCVRGSTEWTVTRGLLAQLAKPDSSSGQGKDLAKRPGEEFVATIKILARTELTKDSCGQPGSDGQGASRGLAKCGQGVLVPGRGRAAVCSVTRGHSAAVASAQALCVPVSVSGPLGAEFSHRPWSRPLPPTSCTRPPHQ